MHYAGSVGDKYPSLWFFLVAAAASRAVFQNTHAADGQDIASFWSELKKRANSMEDEAKRGDAAVLECSEAVKRTCDATRLLLVTSKYPDEDPPGRVTA